MPPFEYEWCFGEEEEEDEDEDEEWSPFEETNPMEIGLSLGIQQISMPGNDEREHWEPSGQPASSSPQVNTFGLLWINQYFDFTLLVLGQYKLVFGSFFHILVELYSKCPWPHHCQCKYSQGDKLDNASFPIG
jgi:hypothetical protein